MSSIVVIGASSDRAKFGNKCVRAYALKGYHVYPVNPREAAIEGWPAFKSILDVPVDSVDRVSIYLPPAIGTRALDEVAQKKVSEVWLNPGADAPEVVKKARELGLNTICGCSIVAIGMSPSNLG
jgi:uncharacterized protein